MNSLFVTACLQAVVFLSRSEDICRQCHPHSPTWLCHLWAYRRSFLPDGPQVGHLSPRVSYTPASSHHKKGKPNLLPVPLHHRRNNAQRYHRRSNVPAPWAFQRQQKFLSKYHRSGHRAESPDHSWPSSLVSVTGASEGTMPMVITLGFTKSWDSRGL